MGSELVTLPNDGGSNPPTIIDVLDEQCSWYMAIGMSCEEYWDGDAALVKYYRKAHELRNKMKNEELWLQGLYVYRAIASFVPVLVTIPEKNAKPERYLEEPFPLSVNEDKEQKDRKAKERYDRIKRKLMEKVGASGRNA